MLIFPKSDKDFVLTVVFCLYFKQKVKIVSKRLLYATIQFVLLFYDVRFVVFATLKSFPRIQFEIAKHFKMFIALRNIRHSKLVSTLAPMEMSPQFLMLSGISVWKFDRNSLREMDFSFTKIMLSLRKVSFRMDGLVFKV